MTISANTLFHFTGDYLNLISILTRDFVPRFSLEDLNVISPKKGYSKEMEFGIPMVSFCDIPLSMVSRHIRIYGRYGIGLEKGWGIRKRITPITYTYKNSELSKTLYQIAKENFRDEKNISNKMLDNFTMLLWLIKPYEGNFIRNKKQKKKYRFYDEREWRYIPKYIMNKYRFGLTKDEFNSRYERDKANLILFSGKRLTFNSSDIRYIIVSKEKEIQDIIDVLSHNAHSKKYPKETLPLIASKIITSERILEDF